MKRSIDARLPWSTHQLLGELFFQAEDMAMEAYKRSCDAYAVAHPAMKKLYRVSDALTHMKEEGANHLLTEYTLSVGVMPAVYSHVDTRCVSWRKRHHALNMPHSFDSKRLGHKLPLSWESHCRMAELCWQLADCLSRSWDIVLRGYGPLDPLSRLVTHQAHAGSPLDAYRGYAESQLTRGLDTHEIEGAPPQASAKIYWQTWTPWATASPGEHTHSLRMKDA